MSSKRRTSLEGDTRELAERHAAEHAESINVPPIKMGTQEWYEWVTTQEKTRSGGEQSSSETESGESTLADPTNRPPVPAPAGHTSTAVIVGIGGAPTRATTFPETAEGRKRRPVASGVLDYFPDALVAIAEVSWTGNEQHNPGQPLHWARGKSGDHADALVRHLMQRGMLDSDKLRHSAKAAWRALALLQEEIENENEQG
jgi:hypothetical protein